MATVTDSVWQARDTTPEAIEKALRRLLFEQHAEQPEALPARVLNLVTVVDKAWAGEIANRMRKVGRYQPSRTIVLEVEPGRRTLDATVSIATQEGSELALARELVVLDVGPQHLPRLESIVDPLVVTDLPTMAWAPHGHHVAVDALLGLAQIVLVDSIDEPAPRDALARAAALVDRVIVVDLAWLRSTPWRERVAALFDPPHHRPALGQISSVTIRHESASAVAAMLLVGWLASRLGWQTSPLVPDLRGGHVGTLRAHRQEIHVTLEPVPLAVRGLAGLTIETADGGSIALDRGRGGLDAVQRRPSPHGTQEQRWTIMGASRGEGGILGEGVRQALLRDPVYPPALAAARELAA
jgi:glucose-6-phosphate dehydrogenase assembly protein OpcA